MYWNELTILQYLINRFNSFNKLNIELNKLNIKLKNFNYDDLRWKGNIGENARAR